MIEKKIDLDKIDIDTHTNIYTYKNTYIMTPKLLSPAWKSFMIFRLNVEPFITTQMSNSVSPLGYLIYISNLPYPKLNSRSSLTNLGYLMSFPSQLIATPSFHSDLESHILYSFFSSFTLISNSLSSVNLFQICLELDHFSQAPTTLLQIHTNSHLDGCSSLVICFHLGSSTVCSQDSRQSDDIKI